MMKTIIEDVSPHVNTKNLCENRANSDGVLDLNGMELSPASLLAKCAGRDKPYTDRVLSTAMADPLVTDSEFRQLAYRIFSGDTATGDCSDHSQADFAQARGMSLRTISTAENRLMKTGYLYVKRQAHGNAVANIIPPHFVSAMIRHVSTGDPLREDIITQWNESASRHRSRIMSPVGVSKSSSQR
jgi:hypothetical protein